MSKNQEYFHLVFSTKNRRTTITATNKRRLYEFIFNLLKDNNCYVYRINGMTEHVHILFDKNPNITMPDLVREIKSKSSIWMKHCGLFPYFEGWGREYCAISKGRDELDTTTKYIINQEVHHRTISFVEEMQDIYRKCGISWHENEFM